MLIRTLSKLNDCYKTQLWVGGCSNGHILAGVLYDAPRLSNSIQSNIIYLPLYCRRIPKCLNETEIRLFETIQETWKQLSAKNWRSRHKPIQRILLISENPDAVLRWSSRILMKWAGRRIYPAIRPIWNDSFAYFDWTLRLYINGFVDTPVIASLSYFVRELRSRTYKTKLKATVDDQIGWTSRPQWHQKHRFPLSRLIRRFV